MNVPVGLVAVVGVLVGVLVGLTGTSGAFLIPTMVYVLRESQPRAQGTALLIGALPVWLVPFIPYYRAHHFNLKMALIIAVGIAAGGYLGGVWAQSLPAVYLKRIFGAVLLIVSIRMILSRE